MRRSLGFTGQSPRAAWMSVWHSPLASILTRTWPGPGVGTGISRISSGAPRAGTTAAFMVLAPRWWVHLHPTTSGAATADREVTGRGVERPLTGTATDGAIQERTIRDPSRHARDPPRRPRWG